MYLSGRPIFTLDHNINTLFRYLHSPAVQTLFWSMVAFWVIVLLQILCTFYSFSLQRSLTIECPICWKSGSFIFQCLKFIFVMMKAHSLSHYYQTRHAKKYTNQQMLGRNIKKWKPLYLRGVYFHLIYAYTELLLKCADRICLCS